MSGAAHRQYLQLVSLMVAVRGAEQREKVWAMAVAGQISLYAPIRPGYTAYASKTMRIASTPADAMLSQRTLLTLPMQRRIDEARRRGVPVIVDPEPRPEIAYLALPTAQVQHLRASQAIHAHWFTHGLRFAHDPTERQAGRLERIALPSQLCLRPTHESMASGPWLDAPEEYQWKVELEDLLLDAAVLPSLLKGDTPAHLTEEPLTLREEENSPLIVQRFLGVRLLYKASEHFYRGNSKASAVTQAIVQEHLRTRAKGRDIEVLFTGDNSRLAFKLINPEHKASKGEGPNYEPKKLTPEAVNDARKYHLGSHISDRLTLVALAAERWHQWVANQGVPQEAIPAQSKLAFISELRGDVLRWGITSNGERNAVMDFAVWPERLVNLREATRNRGSR